MRNRIFVYALCLAMLNFASPQAAQAALVGTLQAVEASSTRAQDMAIVNTALAREQVRGQMAAMGVDPSAVDARVARLTDSELRSLAERMEHMPAGGDALAVIGIVFVVLIILELVGVIDIFKKGLTHRPGTAAVPVSTVSRGRAWAVLALLLALLLLVGCAGPSRLEQLPAELPERVELTATPFHPQTEHQCGPAALATVLGAVGRNVDPAALATEVYLPGRQGSLQSELAAAARARGLVAYETGPSLSDLLAEVAAGRPALVLQQLGAGPWPYWHYAVVIGYDKPRGKLLLRSGTDEHLALRASMFEATWDRGGNWGLVLLEPGTLPAQPDPVRYMSAAAALETAGNPDAAKAAYAAAASFWPKAPLPRLGLGNLAAAASDWVEAERWYGEVLADDPAQAAALNNRAEALVRLGCPDAARMLLQQGTVHVAADDPLQPVLQQTVRDLSAQVASTPALAAAECTQFTVR